MSGKRPAAAKILVPAMLADTDYLFRQAKDGSEAFLAARPFPHLLLPSLLKSACCSALFEGLQFEGQHPPVLRLLLWELSSSTLLRHFTALTGKPPLLPDPFLIHSGINIFAKKEITHTAEQELFTRHPETQLLNVLRMELFVSSEVSGTFTIELVNKQGVVEATQIGSNGSVLFVNSDDYHLRYRCENPSHWRSLLVYYYINDRARCLNGEEQPRASY